MPNVYAERSEKAVELGFFPLPVPYAKKQEPPPGWNKIKPEDIAAQVQKWQKGKYGNGVAYDIAYGWLPALGRLDVEADDAKFLALMPYYLPTTDCYWGRSGRPNSHRIYKIRGELDNITIKDPLNANKELASVRANGLYSIGPGSTHEDTKQPITLQGMSEIPTLEVEADELSRCVRWWEAGSLLARAWPDKGSRHLAANHLIGGLIRSGWSDQEVENFITPILEITGDEETEGRLKSIRTTRERYEREQRGETERTKFTGWASLAKSVGSKIIDRVRDLLRAKADQAHTPEQRGLRDLYLETRGDPLIYARGAFQSYNDKRGLWEQLEDTEVQGEVRATIEANYPNLTKAQLVREVTSLTRMTVGLKGKRLDQDENILVCSNRVVRFHEDLTWTIEGHNSELYATMGVDYPYDPKASAPMFDRYITDLRRRLMLDEEQYGPGAEQRADDTIEFLRQFGAFALTTSNKFECMPWLLGKGGSGKSTFTEALETTARDRAASLSLRQLEHNPRFATSKIVGRTLLLATEQPAMHVTVLDLINAIVSGEKVDIEYKNVAELGDYRSKAKILWAMNDKPTITSPENGIWRRLRLVAFPPQDGKKDEAVKEGIKKEGPGLLNWFLKGFGGLRSSECLLHEANMPERIRRETRLYEHTSNPANMFLDEWGERGATNNIEGSLIVPAYRLWLQNNGHRPRSSEKIRAEFEAAGLIYKRTNTGRYWWGVRPLPTLANLVDFSK